MKDVNSADSSERGAAERAVNCVSVAVNTLQASNTINQGSVADIVKIAMICTWKRLREWREFRYLGTGSEEELFNPQQELKSTRLLLQIHDELLFEVPQEDLPVVCRIVRYCFTVFT